MSGIRQMKNLESTVSINLSRINVKTTRNKQKQITKKIFKITIKLHSHWTECIILGHNEGEPNNY